MKHKTYQLLKRAHFGNLDKEGLEKALLEERDPYVLHVIKLQLKTASFPVQWDTKPFTDQFRSAPPRERLDETVVTFLLRLAVIVKEEAYYRSFSKPESFTQVLAWTHVLKTCLYAVLSLAYDVTWTEEHLLFLDKIVLDWFHSGKPLALRELFRHVGVSLSRKDEEPYPAERVVEKLNYLHAGQFGSFFWRLLHWMAEAVAVRKNQSHAKRVWREFVTGPLYRITRCSICQIHVKRMLEERKSRLLDESEDFARLWFEMHNKVHEIRRQQYFIPPGQEADYSEAEYREDAAFMRQALSPPPK